MTRKILGLLVAGLLGALNVSSANAALISGTWNFTTPSGYDGSFTFTDFDSNATYNESTAAGFSVSTNFDTSGGGGNVFWYPYSTVTDYLVIGGLVTGPTVSAGSTDWYIVIGNFLTHPTFTSFYYGATNYGTTQGSVSTTNVAEPGTLILLGCGLAGLSLGRRRKAA